MINLAIAGASGRMGKTLVRLIGETDGMQVSAALEHSASDTLNMDAGLVAGCGDIGVMVTDQIGGAQFDLMIDFTTPSATLAHVEFCREAGRSIMIGTTGMNEDEKAVVGAAGGDIPVILAANTSVGVNLCVALTEMASKVVGDVMDIEVIEAHHKHKVDAPSGTALLLGEAAAKTLGKTLSKDGVFAREGYTGARVDGSIGFSTIRGGDIAGEHTVLFIGESERIEITHRATDRKIFALGALKAVAWLVEQPAGFYRMQDVLGL